MCILMLQVRTPFLIIRLWMCTLLEMWCPSAEEAALLCMRVRWVLISSLLAETVANMILHTHAHTHTHTHTQSWWWIWGYPLLPVEKGGGQRGGSNHPTARAAGLGLWQSLWVPRREAGQSERYLHWGRSQHRATTLAWGDPAKEDSVCQTILSPTWRFHPEYGASEGHEGDCHWNSFVLHTDLGKILHLEWITERWNIERGMFGCCE